MLVLHRFGVLGAVRLGKVGSLDVAPTIAQLLGCCATALWMIPLSAVFLALPFVLHFDSLS